MLTVGPACGTLLSTISPPVVVIAMRAANTTSSSVTASSLNFVDVPHPSLLFINVANCWPLFAPFLP